MLRLQNARFLNTIPPVVIKDNASWTATEIDTVALGVRYDWLTVLFCLGASDIAMAALKLQESDTAGSGQADITGTVGGTAFTLPSATDDNKIVAFHLDLTKRKRYITLVATAGDGTAGTYASAVSILTRGKEAPDNVTEKGLLYEIIV